MPEHHGQRNVKSHGDPQGILKGRVIDFFAVDGRAHQVHPRKQAAIDQHGQAHDADKTDGVQQAQNQHVFKLRLPTAKGHQQDAGHGKLALFGH